MSSNINGVKENILHRDLQQTKEGYLAIINLHRCGWVLINIFYAPAKV